MAYVPAQSSRSDCRHGLFYRPDAHLWCAVLLFRHRARPAQNSSLRRHAESYNSLDRAADAGSMAVRASTPVLVVRSRREVWQDVVSFAKDMGSQPIRTAFRSPWQNGIAERWVGSCRRDLLDHVIVLNERHLKRLLAEYVRYYHEDRTHLGLAKDTPAGRPALRRQAAGSKMRSFPRLGGLHHRYAA